MQTSSEGRHSVRISGLSTIDFRAGFSRKPTLDFKKTSSRPVQGQWGQPFQIVKEKDTTAVVCVPFHLLSSLISCGYEAAKNTVYCIWYQLSRYSHPHPAQYHWTFSSCSGWQARAPINHRRSDQNLANPLLPWTSAVRTLEHYRVYSAQRGLLPAGDRIRPWRFPLPKSLQCLFLQYYTWSVIQVLTHI